VEKEEVFRGGRTWEKKTGCSITWKSAGQKVGMAEKRETVFARGKPLQEGWG